MTFRVKDFSALLLVLLLAGCAAGKPESPFASDPGAASAANTQLGISYMQQGNNRLAMTSLTKAVEQNSRNAEAHAAMAVLQERLEDNDAAEQSYRRAVRLDQGNPSYHNNYGRFLCSRNQFDRADEQFQIALKDRLYQRRELPLTNAGLCAIRAGKPDKAESYLRRALDEAPGFTPALRQMAELRHDKKDYVSALGYFQRYRERASLDAQMLWLGIQIEHALGNRDAVSSLGLRLRSDYPDSEEASKFRRLDSNG